jgi:hypothetical protein
MRRVSRIARGFLLASSIAAATAFFTDLVLRPSQDRANGEQYAVYSSYLQRGLTGNSHDLGDEKGLVVIHAETIVSDQFVNKSKFNQYRFLLGSAGNAEKNIAQLRPSVLFEFFISNLREERLERRFTLSAAYALATEEEMSLYPPEQFLKRFRGSYGYLTFSRVGFNRDLTEAFFYTEHVCGLCGVGRYVFMRKVNGQWVVEGTSSTWIS